MAENSKIEWTNHTFNPWIGCTKVSPACDNCYAEAQDAYRKWTPEGWGPGKPRRLTSKETWAKVFAWHRKAIRTGVRQRVLCASLADVFDAEVSDEWRDMIFALIALTPALDWLLLTKRPKVAKDYLDGIYADDEQANSRITGAVNRLFFWLGTDWGKCGSTSTAITTLISGTGAREPMMLRLLPSGEVQRLIEWTPESEKWFTTAEEYASRVRGIMMPGEFGWGLKELPLPNLWLGTSVESQAMANTRVPWLLKTPAAQRFLSCEPLLGPVDLTQVGDAHGMMAEAQTWLNALGGFAWDVAPGYYATGPVGARINWVIAGGESGSRARPAHPDWFRSLRDQCAAAGVPFLFKQHGEWIGEPDLQHLPGGGGPGFGAFDHCPHDMDAESVRVGKAKAGRLLDGQLHDAIPGAPLV